MSDLLTLARNLRPYIEQAAQLLPDADGLKAKALYPRWEALVKKGSVTAEAGYRFTHGGNLYKCVNANPTFQSDWVPGVGTAALYVRIDEAHAGTLSDPIPAARSMEYTYGLHYADPEDGKVYLCTRTGEADGGTITLHYLPHELVGLYFEEVTSDAEG